MAESIFGDMTGGWDDTCGGGIWWKKDRHYKNAIANELFLSIAAHLAARTNGAKKRGYLARAKREWDWFDASGMINDENLVSADRVDHSSHGPPACQERLQCP
jgi:predicted alpha-1,6-mannanase (GH76 family)